MKSNSTKAVPKRWLGLAVLTLPVLLTSMDISILHLAIPAITEDLAPSTGQMLWILDVYGFLLAGLLILMGGLGDRVGRRRLLLIGAVVFGAASVLAAFADSPEWLIAARALMGIGGATLMPSTLSLIRTMFDDPTERSRAIAVWTAALAGGVALGPIIGGVLLQYFPWGSVFLINVPVILLLLAAAPLLIPEYRHATPSPLDPLSVALSFLAILPIVWAVKTGAEELAVTAGMLIAIAVGILAGIVFLRRQGRLTTPLVDVSLFANRRFTGSVLAGALAMFSLVGLTLYLSQHLQLVLDFSPLTAALWMLPITAGIAAAAITTSALAARVGPGPIFGVAAGLAATGMIVVSLTPADGGLAQIIVGAVLAATGISPITTLATDVVVATAPPSQSGSASALAETANELGAAFGIAVLGSLGSLVYRAEVVAELPAGLGGELEQILGSSLGAALGVLNTMPTEMAAPLMELVREAFVEGLAAATLAGGVVLGVLAVLVSLLLRGQRPTGQTE
ncbi:MFS transporter [Actinoalloteichus hymeniacidonis]|uniref:Arabinose efflux permease family protein n=1 Tax=Actinoalloteichus hymeniacidonis TaxID=340345 RepID=A0AAC9HTD2_9PSEU|nr:MFS transporter [Actinoalloteichus hymeniacidonis]AOS64766.1 arabinose efflux permease family protein [Actinoalloteichus hymeniacidonis]MBB5907158.1 DHA2 family multidrug resistance protein-like MFS transporter [Actinoalloteichus hymeniacidonis]